MKEEIIGTTGVLVDLFNKELTQEEWNALCVVHRLSARLNVRIRFDWSASIDVRVGKCSQIIDESVFLNKELKKVTMDQANKETNKSQDIQSSQDSSILRNNLILALFIAIEQKEKEEKAAGYTSDSALLAGWRENLNCLTNGGILQIK